MKILVTGASGYIGMAVCEALRAAGEQPVGLARSAEAARKVESRGCLVCRGDLNDAASLSAATVGVDAVIHAARDHGPGGGPDRQATETLLRALEGSRRAFVYSSGTWVIGDTQGRMVGEMSPLNPPPAVAWRPPVERLVLDAADRGVNSVVLRPGNVFGRKGGRVAQFFADAAAHNVVRVVGDGRNHWSTVHIDDLAALYVRAVLQAPAGELFIACGGMPQPVGKIAAAVAEACGIAGRVEHIPLEQARAEMGPLADLLTLNVRAGSTKAARYLGWTVTKPSVFDEIASGSYLA